MNRFFGVLLSLSFFAPLTTAHAMEEEDPLEQYEPSMSSKIATMHYKARDSKSKPKFYPPRFEVPDEMVSWDVAYSSYDPFYNVSPGVAKAAEKWDDPSVEAAEKWSDPIHITAKLRDLIESRNRNKIIWMMPKSKRIGEYDRESRSWVDIARSTFDTELPQNPCGRTGINGRGSLGKWAANYAADTILIREGKDGQFELLVIQRKDNNLWALPGGMVNNEESSYEASLRELKEETGIQLASDTARVIFEGYVDDPRNTDNSWMETTVYARHLTKEEAKALGTPHANDDAREVKWMVIDDRFLDEMHADHGQYLWLALQDISAGDS